MRFEAGREDQGARLDVFLTRFFQDRTRSRIQAMNRAGSVLVNGKREKGGYRIRTGDVVQVEAHEREASALAPLAPESMPLEVLYEDDVMAVIEKPAGIVVHPGAGNRSGTLANALRARFRDLSDAGGPRRPGIVHRLDKWTSGLILIAKDNTAHHRLSKSFATREVRKAYLALVHGRLRNREGTIELNIGRHPSSRTRMAVQGKRGRPARSEFRVLESSSAFSMIRVGIHTGRTHQIRVHLSAVGHPVVGDSTYGEKANRRLVQEYGPIPRYFLHATELEFPHPATGQTVAFHSPLPVELERLWARLKQPVTEKSVGRRRSDSYIGN